MSSSRRMNPCWSLLVGVVVSCGNSATDTGTPAASGAGAGAGSGGVAAKGGAGGIASTGASGSAASGAGSGTAGASGAGTGTAGASGAGTSTAGASGAGSSMAGASGAGTGVAGASGAGSGTAGASSGTAGAGGSNGGSAGATGSNGGAAGAAGGGQAGGSTVASDYPYCDYGTVPSGTAPVWNDAPTLTPIGLNPYGTPATTIPVGYILLSEGAQGVTQVPKATQSSILTRINADLKFETAYSYIHMPPFSTGAKATHYIDYLLVDTGLPNDPNAGGDSSYEGQYPDVETTQVAMTDQSQRYDLTHEFNHVLENAYGTVPGNSVSWIQESYNDYLILLTAENANGATPGQAAQYTLPGNVGYLDVLVYQQPYVPIESCGINGDASTINGPADYFTDTTAYRYNDLFPLFVAQRVGQHFFAAVWEQAKTTEQILQTMTRLLDKKRVQCMVGEYSARLALGDFKELSSSIQKVDGDAGMYMPTTNQAGWLVPSTTNKLPRYTGRNNIPITVTSGASQVSVNFAADAAGSKGTVSQMVAQIAYRATDGTVVFSPPVSTGTTSVTLTKAPKNGVVTVVITNVTMDGYKAAKSYGWDPSETFGYKIQVTGGTAAATTKTYF
jgi:Family of unknown function (DUF6055)